MSLKSVLSASLLVAVAAAHAQTAVASAISTIRPAGPRSGGSNSNFFNVEGSGNNANASFGVLDFNASSFGAPTSVSVLAASLALTESNASFTAPATIHFYAAANTTASIANDGTSTLTYQTPGDATNSFGVGSQLGTLLDLGTGSFTTTGNTGSGTVDTYALTLNANAQSYFASALTSGAGKIRLVLAAENASGAATFAGITNTTYPNGGPALTLTTQAVPEPSAFAALGLGAVALLRRRRSAE